MNVLIIDDELLTAKYLERLLLDSQFKITQTTIVEEPLEVLEMNLENFQAIFIDMNMPSITGIELLKRLKLPDSLPVVITTAYEEFALKGYGLNTVGFLLKPVEEDQLREVLFKVIDFRKKPSQSTATAIKKLKVLVGKEYHLLAENDIVHVMGEGSYSKIVTRTKSYTVTKVLSELEKDLSRTSFFRVHRSHIIRLDEVEKLGKKKDGYLILKNQTTIPISSTKRELLENLLGV